MDSRVAVVTNWLHACALEFEANLAELDRLDLLLGDGDHGTNMWRGFAAAQTLELSDIDSPNEALRQVGMALVSNVGGSSGPLFGTFLLRTGANWPAQLSTAGIERALRLGLAGVVARGKAEAGDKTMIDALVPAVDSLAESAATGVDFAVALRAAAESAAQGRDATADMIARRGRAQLRADDSLGILDPGAVSMSIIIATAAKHLAPVN